jgi:hypothetical protein
MAATGQEQAGLIAPCGMNCAVCRAHLRDRKKCPGCRGEDNNKSVSCVKCIIRNCETIKTSQSGFCYECPEYPCRRLKDLDKRYRTKYGMSMVENLESIRANGLSAFVAREVERWGCRNCGGVICVHSGYCQACGEKKPVVPFDSRSV